MAVRLDLFEFTILVKIRRILRWKLTRASDRDFVFMGKFRTTLFSTPQIKKSPSRAYHLYAAEQIKLRKRDVEEMIREFLNHRKNNKDDLLIQLEEANNSAVYRSTLHSLFCLN